LALSTRELQSRDLGRIRWDLLDIERDRVMQSFRQGVLGRKSQQKLLADIDARLSELETDDEAVAGTSDAKVQLVVEKLRGRDDQDQNQHEDRG
jgi:hypothetical protein